MKSTIDQEYKGYTPRIKYSEEDGCFIGTVAGLNRHAISFEGDSEEAVRKDFEAAIDFYLTTTKNPEKPFSGRLVLDIPSELHMELSRKAYVDGEIHLNTWIIDELKESLHG